MVETPQSSQPVKVKQFPIMELFGPTLQGEGSVIGMQTMFVRFGGCDYRCTKCDSLHAVLPELIKLHGTKYTAEQIVNELEEKAGHCRMVTFSGGNPCMWDLTDLVDLLKSKGWCIAVETQGTIFQDWLENCDYITVSPKGPGMGEKFEPEKFEVFYTSFEGWNRGFSVKIVIMDQRDIEFAKQIIDRWPTKLYLSLGNPWPPLPAQRETDPTGISMHTFQSALLARMDLLWEEIKKEPLFKDARFLPQMHTLLWGSEKGR